MNRTFLRRLVSSGSIDLVESLTARQYLLPHQPLAEALRAAADELGCCPQAVDRAVRWLQIDASQPVGRLRRSELLQLARSIQRFWRHTASEATVQNAAD